MRRKRLGECENSWLQFLVGGGWGKGKRTVSAGTSYNTAATKKKPSKSRRRQRGGGKGGEGLVNFPSLSQSNTAATTSSLPLSSSSTTVQRRRGTNTVQQHDVCDTCSVLPPLFHCPWIIESDYCGSSLRRQLCTCMLQNAICEGKRREEHLEQLSLLPLPGNFISGRSHVGNYRA